MKESHLQKIANELGIETRQVNATASLLENEATVPFIARYRKEATGSLDEVVITTIRDRLEQLVILDQRRDAIMASLLERDLLTDDLRQQLAEADTLTRLEDIYLPYRPKKRTRAIVAREKGLEPLAQKLFDQTENFDPIKEASAFVDPSKEVATPEDALAGARDIIAEWVNEDQQARELIRDLYRNKSEIISRVVKDKEKEGSKYQDYFDWREPIKSVASHRLLAMRRGESEGFLTLQIRPNPEEALAILNSLFVRDGGGTVSDQVRLAVEDGYKRLLSLAMETEMRIETKRTADEEAIRVFAENLRELLLASPLGQKTVMAIDPGFRTGCKVVCLDRQGKLLRSDTIFIHQSGKKSNRAERKIRELVEEFNIEAIAIGNGTGGRETESFIRKLELPRHIAIGMVNESGASVYSASEVARREFPDQDITVRGAVSIGRRLMDPLAELVKIDPKSIGVGQYQHDVNQTALKKCLDDVVVSCVNRVGVDVNTASPELLSYVSGIGPGLAANIVAHRDQHGPFSSRRDFLNVQRFGPKAFEQAAGFLRIRDGSNPLDSSAVHPESYWVVDQISKDLGCRITDIVGHEDLMAQIEIQKYVSDKVGLPTLKDILGELQRPGRDPRSGFEIFNFAEGVQSIDDLIQGMKLPGVVTNVTAFGAFVDVGVHQDGLVHISRLANRFVKDPSEVVKVHQKVWVTVVEVDRERKRISLSMKEHEDDDFAPVETPKPKQSAGSSAPKTPKAAKAKPVDMKKTEKPSRSNWFTDALQEAMDRKRQS